MALSGNRLGPRTKVQYVADNGSTYILNLDADLIIVNSGLVIGTIGGVHPIGWKPRGVHAQLIDNGKIYRKFLICGTADSTLYATDTPQIVNLDGAAFTTTGRRGEVQRFI